MPPQFGASACTCTTVRYQWIIIVYEYFQLRVFGHFKCRRKVVESADADFDLLFLLDLFFSRVIVIVILSRGGELCNSLDAICLSKRPINISSFRSDFNCLAGSFLNQLSDDMDEKFSYKPLCRYGSISLIDTKVVVVIGIFQTEGYFLRIQSNIGNA